MVNKQTRHVPHANLYDNVDWWANIADYLLYGVTFTTLVVLIGEKLGMQDEVKDNIARLNALLAVSYAGFDVKTSFLLFDAEVQRRLGLVDNSFDAQFVGDRSEGYYNNEGVSPSLYKMAANSFESCFTTCTVLGKMLKRAYPVSIFIISVFLISALTGAKDILRLMIELPLTLVVLQKLLKLQFYHRKAAYCLDEFKRIFNTFRERQFLDSDVPATLRNILDYEASISWASTPLSSSIFGAFRIEMAAKWEQLRRLYRIP